MKSFLNYATILTSSLAIILSQVVTVEAATKCATLTVPSEGVKWESVTYMEGIPETVNRFQALDAVAILPKHGPVVFQASIGEKGMEQHNLPMIKGLQYRFEWILTNGDTYNYWLNSGGDCINEKGVPFTYSQVEKVNIYKRIP